MGEKCYDGDYITKDFKTRGLHSSYLPMFLQVIGSSVPSLVTGGTVFFSEQPVETITQQRENSPQRVGLNIQCTLPKVSQAFETAVLNRGP